MDPTQDNVQTLLSMGFPNETDVRRALRLAKNDLNEAVAILTNEHPSTQFDGLDDIDVEMKEEGSDRQSTGPGLPLYGPAPPPSYDELVESDSRLATPEEEKDQKEEPESEDCGLEFPIANLYELENRVFTESWSIPYKKEESLGKCLVAAARLAKEGLADSDQYCSRFMSRCMPESIQKLMTSGAVHRWGPEIQQGIYDMLQLLVDLVAARLNTLPINTSLMRALELAFNPETEFHTKNRSRRPDKAAWDEVFGDGLSYAVSPAANTYKEPYGWLTNLINRFAELKGFELVRERITGDMDAPAMASLFAPFGACAEFLNPKVVTTLLAPGMEIAVKFVNDLSDNDLKEKKVGSVCEMLATMKLLCLQLWKQDVQGIDDLRLSIVLRMLNSPHFNAKMNSLKEVTHLIEMSSGTRTCKYAISHEKILLWLVENRVLSIALEGNIDQVQYCDKIKNIVDFLGTKLSVDELTKIWRMQNGETSVVIDNIHAIIAAAGVKFNAQQLEHLFILIQKSWEVENDRMREKLLSLIGKIGREARIQKTTTRVLELLWDLAHLPALPTALIEQALDEHLAILNDSYAIKDMVKNNYAFKCVDEIKEGKWVLPALKQLLQITKNITKHSFHKAEKGILHQLHQNDIIKQVTNSLVKFHQVAHEAATRDGIHFSPDTLVDGRYSHRDFVEVHLSVLQFILQEGVYYLGWHRARDLWDSLVANPSACEWDRETCFEWFTKGITDLDQDTQSQLFQKELLRMDPAKVTIKGFRCFKCFFENINQYENKLKKCGTNFTVEKTDLIGYDYLWELCLNVLDPDIAELAISLMMNMSYSSLTPRLKRDPLVLHKKFIDECYSRLETAMIPLGGSTVAQTLCLASQILTAVSVPEVASVPSPSRSANLVNIERLLLIAERYIVTVEELHTAPRTILPHGASFQGHPLNLYVVCETQKMEFNFKTHSNESVRSIRFKIAHRIKVPPESVQIMANEKMLTKDQKLLAQLNIEDHQVLSVRSYSSAPAASTSSLSLDTSGARHSFDLEQEKMLPGVVMATGGHVFEMLYQLADLDEPRITSRARNLLKLIPTDQYVQDALDSLGQKRSNGTEASPKPSPRPSPKPSPKHSPRPPRKHPLPLGPAGEGRSPESGIGVAGLVGTASLVASPGLTSSGKWRTEDHKETLLGLFDADASGMSTFRVLYNLEVLSSKLMPTVRDSGTIQSAKTFCEDFLNSAGLSLVVNVLQKDAIPSDVDYGTRQGCYAIALQLLRYLLCGLDSGGDVLPGGAQGGRRGSTGSSSAGAAVSSNASSEPPSLEITPAAASRAIQTMAVNDFTQMVACFMRVTWAAAAGKLHLASSGQPIKESSVMTSSGVFNASKGRLSTGSSGSAASSGSESDMHCLQSGVCVRQSQVTPKDTNIAKEALELLVTCLQLRSQLLATFYGLPCVSDFLIEVLVGSTQAEIRDVALEQLYTLSQTDVPPAEGSHQQTPHHFILQTLHGARLPFWVSSSSTRGASFRLLSQCKQYFELKCRLLAHLTESEQKRLAVNIQSMLEDEIGWLSNFVPSDGTGVKDTDNMLMAGHLRLIRTLLTCQGVNKSEIGKQITDDLLHEFLFPASKMILESPQKLKNITNTYTPKCSSPDARVAAYELLVELADGCLENLKEITSEITTMHHKNNPEMANQWEYMPPVDSRAICGYVGLKNGGATCYMNAVLQQLYMSPGVPEAILSVDEDGGVEEESVLFQIQQAFGHLMDSKLQYYVPEKFWKVFLLWGQSINIREQQDALDFYQAVIDQMDDQIKKIGKESIFKKRFQGVFSDQKICKDCPHRYEREEVFYALNVTVKNATLQDSLDQFVAGNLLEGDNAYFCEKCGEKRNTLKRLCIKTLPPVLCIQLKRFDYDWEANRALKFDDYFKFPFVLDMEPYTAEGMARMEAQEAEVNSTPIAEPIADSDTSRPTTSTSAAGTCCGGDTLTVAAVGTKQINYELVGVVVHSGQANAGHYYSFIKDRRGNYMENSNKGKWFKFNDTFVEEFEMSEAALEAECFGGKYKARVYDQSNSYGEERLRYWNGYLLFYERMEDIRTPVSAKKTKVQIRRPQTERKSGSLQSRRQDSLVELTELVHKGEKRGIFLDKMPARIQQVVRDENLRFMKNRDVYDVDYLRFVRNVATASMSHPSDEKFSAMCVTSMEMSVYFLFNTYLRTKRKLRADLDDWVNLVGSLLHGCKQATTWLVEYFAGAGKSNIKPFLLESPSKEIRQAYAKILEKMMASFFHHGGVPTHKCFDEVIEKLLSLLDKDVADNNKHCVQYFNVLLAYVQMGSKPCSHMYGRQAFKRLMHFLLGSIPESHHYSDQQEGGSRRWSSIQARDYGSLHMTLAILIINCDISPYRTEPLENFATRLPTTLTPQIYFKMSNEMSRYLFGPDTNRYIKEVVLALREVQAPLESVEDMLICCSFCNSQFSLTVLKNIMFQYSTAPSNELKTLLQVLLSLLLIEDTLQLKRLQCVIDGVLDEQDNNYEGMLAVIKLNHVNDSRRSYQCIKFLVSLSNRCQVAKDYLMQSSTKWQWAVNWLKKQMTEHYWSPNSSSVTSNEDSSSKSFQRTISAQDTLAEATALLTELEAGSDMEVNGDKGSGENTDDNSSGNQESPSPEVDSQESTQPYTVDFALGDESQSESTE